MVCIALKIVLGLVGASVCVCKSETDGDAPKYFATCTPWLDGARPCPDRGHCVAPWDNANARWADDAACQPADYVAIMSSDRDQGPAPTCRADADCAAGRSCVGEPAACRVLCAVATDCGGSKDPSCSWDCLRGACAMYCEDVAELVKCRGAEPLTDDSGKELFCGRGSSRVDCPAGSMCDIHPADAWAVCCPDGEHDEKPLSKCGGAEPLADDSGKELFCGRGSSHVDCPADSTCDVHPADAWAVCCPVSVPDQSVNPANEANVAHRFGTSASSSAVMLLASTIGVTLMPILMRTAA